MYVYIMCVYSVLKILNTFLYVRKEKKILYILVYSSLTCGLPITLVILVPDY